MEQIGRALQRHDVVRPHKLLRNSPERICAADAIELEADRMRNLRIQEEDLASEMTVVRNEYERGENNPVRTLIKEIFAAAFVAHPYGHPTIGWESDIENTSTREASRFLRHLLLA